MATDLNHLSINIRESYSDLKNWRRVADAYGITSGLAFRIANQGYEPKEPQLRVKLGLPALIPTPACVNCGVVHHLGEICPVVTPVQVIVYSMTAEELAKVQQPVTVVYKKPKSTVKCKPRPRASINLTDPRSAAATITKHMSAGQVSELVKELTKGVP